MAGSSAKFEGFYGGSVGDMNVPRNSDNSETMVYAGIAAVIVLLLVLMKK